MEIKVLGTGCATCRKLERLTEKAVEELGIDATIAKEEDVYRIMQYGVMRTPGLVIDEKVVLSGRIPKMEELKKILSGE